MKDVTLEEACPGIRYRFRVTTEPERHDPPVLVVSFDGEYRDGSLGNPDAAFMCGVVALACNVWDHRGVVIDLTGLEYRWGDRIDALFSHPQIPSLPVAVVLGPRCRRALATLWFGEETEREPTEEVWAFDRLDEAIKYVRARS